MTIDWSAVVTAIFMGIGTSISISLIWFIAHEETKRKDH